MKRIVFLACLMLAFLSGCGGADARVTIDGCVWQMTTVQSTEHGGEIVAFGPGETGMPDAAAERTLTCEAADGALTLTDASDGTTYSGTYRKQEQNALSVIYEITMDDTQGMAVAAATTRSDGSETPTLILTLGDYALNFAPAGSPAP